MKFVTPNEGSKSDQDSVKKLVSSVVNMASNVVSETYTVTFNEKKRRDKLKRMVGVHNLKGSIVKQNIHNVMSPISAISGYLELINMHLLEDPDVNQIEYYREKIELGIREVNTIVEQLHGIYQDDLNDDFLDVDLNWLIEDVCSQLNSTKTRVVLTENVRPIHISTEIFIAKLIIFDLIKYAVKSTINRGQVTLITDCNHENAFFSIFFNCSEKKKQELAKIFMNQYSDVLIDDKTDSYNEGLINSINLAKQIDSSIRFIYENNEKATFKLTIPLSENKN